MTVPKRRPRLRFAQLTPISCISMNTLQLSGLLSTPLAVSLSVLSLGHPAWAQSDETVTQVPLSVDAIAHSHPLAPSPNVSHSRLARQLTRALSDITLLAEAQLVGQQSETEVVSESLRIPPRFGAGYTTDGGSHSSLGRFETFVPLWQVPGEAISFLEGRLVMGEADDFGGSILVGYRDYLGEHNRIRGGYIGIDGRSTGNSDFFQLGLGYESLGENWDFRINGYLPLGDRSNTITDSVVDTGLQLSSRFAGNQLIVDSQRQRQRLFQQEIALGGLDAEAGYQIWQWDEGDLKAFGGLYLYDAPELDTYLGWRLRLAANFTPNFSGGLALQDDGLFGSRLVLSVGATFPGHRPSGAIADADQVPARLGESVVRSPELAVYVDEESETLIESASTPLQNPEEEAAYRFQHVILGAAGGDGTFENPFGTVQAALAATVGDGNDVVYVDGNNGVAIPAFAIPDRVQVLSQGPVQTLAGLPFPGFASRAVRLPFSPSTNFANGIAVELPFSGDGIFPSIENGVTLGNRTVLAGFQINGAAGDAIAGTNVSNAELRNNTITNAGGRGIALNNVGGSVVLFDNIIRNTAVQGIFAQNTSTDRPLDLAIIGYDIDTSSVGMEFSALSSGGITSAPSQIITVLPSDAALNTSQGNSGGAVPSNAITNSVGEGLIVRSQGTALTNVTTQEFSFDRGTITNSGSSGVRVLTDQGAGSQEFSLTNSVISANNGAGIQVQNGTANPTATAHAQEIFIRGNQIIDNAASGIDIELNARGAQEVTVDSNQILRNGGDGIRSVARLSGLQEFPILADGSAGISNNIISGNAEQAIDVEVNDSASIAVLNVRDNTLQSNGGGTDIDVRATATTSSACTVILNNTVPTGIELHTFSITPANRATFLVQDLNNLSFNNNGALAQLINDNTGLPDPSAFSNEANFCVP